MELILTNNGYFNLMKLGLDFQPTEGSWKVKVDETTLKKFLSANEIMLDKHTSNIVDPLHSLIFGFINYLN